MAGLFHWVMGTSQREIENIILALCLERGPGKTICPSEVARALDEAEDVWRALMPLVRNVAQRLAQQGQIAIYSKGSVRPDHDIAGVIRLGLPPEA